MAESEFSAGWIFSSRTEMMVNGLEMQSADGCKPIFKFTGDMRGIRMNL